MFNPSKMNNEMKLVTDLENHFYVYVDKHFYPKDESDRIFQELEKEVAYNLNTFFTIYGKKIPIPRKQTAYGDPGTSYSFSNTTTNAKPWIPILQKIKNDIEYFTGKTFNFCLVNRYEDGNQYIGYHKDSEIDLVEEPSIVSLSFGATRKFYFKSDKKNVKVVKLDLNHGCLCWIIDPTNKTWKHSVPKEPKVKLPRINITFRHIAI
jgi:alkylated DNA repair dioxygenase AlkB